MHFSFTLYLLITFIMVGFIVSLSNVDFVKSEVNSMNFPIVSDSNITIKEIAKGLPDSISSIDFLDTNNFLALGKTTGEVYLITNDTLQSEPVLRLDINGTVERGLLGIAVEKKPHSKEIANTNLSSNNTAVYLYYSEIHDNNTNNRLYKYEWNGSKLLNPKLILNLPLTPGPHHNGGKLAFGPDGFLYVTIGDYEHNGILQNNRNGNPADDTGVIMRINSTDGSGVKDNPFSSNSSNGSWTKYFGYGIRNSFGIAFDPITGKLWQTENGPEMYDEINTIPPGFNGGWKLLSGPMERSNITISDLMLIPNAKYSDPILSWKHAIGITGLDFMSSSKLGDKYLNNLFVGDFNNGNLYHLVLNEARTGFVTDDIIGLDDLVIDGENEKSSLIFGKGFGRITDVKTGPDGYLYVVDYGFGEMNGNPPIHRIFKIFGENSHK